MAFQVSPGVEVKEIDLTNVVPAVSTSIGGFVGAFNWGPVGEIRLIGSEKELASVFGVPTDSDTFTYFQTAASFLKYGNALKVVRAKTSAFNNASSDGGALLIENIDDYENNHSAGEDSVGEFGAKYPGSLGNSIKISVCTASATAYAAWDYAANFASAPGTSATAATRGGSNDEMHIIIVDADGKITGSEGTILEKFEYVSQASDARKEDGTSNYYKDVLNNSSKWVWVLDNMALANIGTTANNSFATEDDPDTNGTWTLTGGADDNTATAGELQLGYDLFADSEVEDVNLIFSVPVDTGHAQYLINLAEQRKDCVVFISPEIADSTGSNPLADVTAFFSGLTSSSYAVFDSTALKVYDKYNDVYRWIPASGYVAGLCANTDRVADAWFSPAGFNRGQLRGVTKIAYNPKKADRDALYKARINPIASFPGEGTVLYGDKTGLAKPSAFDRINVRRLFIVLEKAIATAAKYQLFEFNDEFTRAQFRNMVEPFLRDVQGRRGITDFYVVCDETNNTGQVIDTNNFVADIYIKPARSINFISLNFIATRTGVEFSEIIGQ